MGCLEEKKPWCFGNADPYDAQCHWKPDPCPFVKKCSATYRDERRRKQAEFELNELPNLLSKVQGV